MLNVKKAIFCCVDARVVEITPYLSLGHTSYATCAAGKMIQFNPEILTLPAVPISTI